MANIEEMKREAADAKRKPKEEAAYNAAMRNTPPAPVPANPASGINRGEAGKKWVDHFSK